MAGTDYAEFRNLTKNEIPWNRWQHGSARARWTVPVRHVFQHVLIWRLPLRLPPETFKGADTVNMLIPLDEKTARTCAACVGALDTATGLDPFGPDCEGVTSPATRCDGQERYHRLFNAATLSIWEMDLSDVKRAVDTLKHSGVDDIRGYLKGHPEYTPRTLSTVRIIDVNTATLKLFRVENKSDFFESIDKYLTPKSLPVFYEFLVALYQEEPSFDGEVIGRTLSGEDINIQIHIELPRNLVNYDSVIVSALDISERKRLEVQFLSAQKMEAIGTLASGIAHDFNNLLMAIEGLATLMIQDTGAEHPHYTTLQKIEKQVLNGAKLTAQLLGYARKERPQVTYVDLNQVIRDTTEAFGRARKQIAVDLDLDQNLLPLKADPGQIEQVLLNLCVNAADAMPDGGRLTLQTANTTHKSFPKHLAAARPGDYAQLVVCDTGAGMDEDTRARIFEPFFTTKTMGRGTGLGLVSVLGIIKRLGGVIAVDSEKEHGTTFRIYLPASRQASQKKLPAAGAPSNVHRSQTVLLVDDEEVVLDVGTRMLQRIGLTVLSAGNGKDALRIYAENKDRIELVVLDMVMPDMGGKVVFDRMKQMNSTVKVLLASGYSLNDEAAEIMRNGCDGFIQKPYNLQALTAKIDQILQKS